MENFRFRFLLIFLQSIQRQYWAHPASYGIGIGGSFREVKQTELKCGRSTPSSSDFNKAWVYKLRLYECTFIVMTKMYALYYTVSICQ